MGKKDKYDMSRNEIIANNLHDYFLLFEKIEEFGIQDYLPEEYKRFTAIESVLNKSVLTGKEIIEVLEIYNSLLEDRINEESGERYNRLFKLFKKQRKRTSNLKQELDGFEDSGSNLVKELRNCINNKEGTIIEDLKKIITKYNFYQKE